jgi:hypothetical protein
MVVRRSWKGDTSEGKGKGKGEGEREGEGEGEGGKGKKGNVAHAFYISCCIPQCKYSSYRTTSSIGSLYH